MQSNFHSGRQKKPKRPKIKKERAEKPPSAPSPALPVPAAEDDAEKDLTHYIRDRVELMRQIFSILKDRELVAMAPQCLRTVKVDDLQELCLDEVLGISSTRLASILDGCDCPSDTDSSDASQGSAPPELETISLDSISSDEAQLAPTKAKQKKKHHRRHQSARPPGPPEPGPAGMTVLELLELQARARAIRAQLQAVHANIGSDPEEGAGEPAEAGSEDEVVIKEEPPEVVELVSSSSDGEQLPDKKCSGNAKKSSTSASTFKEKSKNEQAKAVPTLVVSIPAMATQNPPRKIKLKRNNLLVSVTNVAGTSSSKAAPGEANSAARSPVIDLDKAEEVGEVKDAPKDADNDRQEDRATQANAQEKAKNDSVLIDGVKSSKTKRVQEASVPFDGRIDKSVKDRLGKVRKTKNRETGKASKKKSKTSIDEDEIMLELSDTEKNDLLDSFNSETSSDGSSESEGAKCTVQGSLLTAEDNQAMKPAEGDEVMKAAGGGELAIARDEIKNTDNEDKVASSDEAIVANKNDSVDRREVIDLDSGGEVAPTESRQEVTASTADVVNDPKDLEAIVPKGVDADKSLDIADLDHRLAEEPELSQREEVEEGETKDTNQSSKKKKKKAKKSSKESRRRSVAFDDSNDLEQVSGNVGKKKRQNSAKDLENLQQNNAVNEVVICDSLSLGKHLESREGGEPVVSLQVPEEELSEGECSYSSDGIEITELKHDVVCISDDAVSVDSDEAGRPKEKKYRKRRKSNQDQGSSSSSPGDCETRKDASFDTPDTEVLDNSQNTDEELAKYDDVKEVESVCVVQDDTPNEKLDEISLDGPRKDPENRKTDLKSLNNAKKDPIESGHNKIDSIKTEKMDLVKGSIIPDSAADRTEDDDFEVFEISDDSSDEEAVSCLSKEPTTEEIVELSKKIDSEIEREDIVFERRITGEVVDVEMRQEILKSVGVSAEELSDSSWKERWLKSDKVKKVLATSNLCNALRKKNKEMKMKLVEDAKAEHSLNKKDEESKLTQKNKSDTRVEVDLSVDVETNQSILEALEAGAILVNDLETIESDECAESRVETIQGESEAQTEASCIQGVRSGVPSKSVQGEIPPEATEIDAAEPSKLAPDEGSVDLYMTLASCTKYVDPVIDHIEEDRRKAMAKDARQLMKMYKKLVKIHSKVAGQKKKKKKDKKEKKKIKAICSGSHL